MYKFVTFILCISCYICIYEIYKILYQRKCYFAIYDKHTSFCLSKLLICSRLGKYSQEVMLFIPRTTVQSLVLNGAWVVPDISVYKLYQILRSLYWAICPQLAKYCQESLNISLVPPTTKNKVFESFYTLSHAHHH